VPEYKVKDLAAAIGGDVAGDGERFIRGVNGVGEAGPEDASFVANPRYLPLLKNTRAGAVVVGKDVEAAGVTLIKVDAPYVAFMKIVVLFAPPPSVPQGVSPSAFVHASARLGADVGLGPFAVVDAGAVVGDRTTIGAGSYVGRDARVGSDTLLYANVTLRERVRIGDRCIFHPGVVIGSDGFGFATQDDIHHKIPQIGTVVIEDDVEIGANTTVDRGTLGETRIGRGSKLDNLIQIAHNVQIGEGTLIAAQTGISGSTKVGNYCVFAGQVGVVGHITIGDRAILAAQAGVAKSVPPGATYWGFPARPIMEVKRDEARIKMLEKLFARVRALEHELELLKKEKGGDVS